MQLHSVVFEQRKQFFWGAIGQLQRVFKIDIQNCEHCGGAVKVIASIEAPAAINPILENLDRQAQATPLYRRCAGLSVRPGRRDADDHSGSGCLHACAGRRSGCGDFYAAVKVLDGTAGVTVLPLHKPPAAEPQTR